MSPPGALLVRIRSAVKGVIVIDALAVLLPMLGSAIDALKLALLLTVAGVSARTRTVRIIDAPLLTVPRLHVTVCPLMPQPLALTTLTCAGSVVLMTVSGAGSGPALLTVNVRSSSSRSLTVLGVATWLMLKSAASGVIVTLVDALLFPALGSGVVVVTVAVLVMPVGVLACTVIVRVMVAPLATVPRLHVTFWPLAVHPLAETKLTAAGSVSVRVTLAALVGPLLVTVRM